MLEQIQEFESQLFLQKVPLQGNSIKGIMTDSDINQKYIKGDIRIVTEQARYPLPSIKDMVINPDYELHPDFQRRHRWNREKQSRLIESFIMNVPIPPIFLYEKEFSNYEVMDGLQRLTAIKEYYCDEYPLEGLEEWPELNGRTYSQLPSQIKKGIDRRYISSIILLKETAKSEKEALALKQMVFSRINSGGAKLEDQEYRNAQYKSEFNQMLQIAARNEIFCEIFDIPLKTDEEDLANDIISAELRENRMFQTMKDAETVLRFFAVRLCKQLWGNCPLRKYLDQFEAIMSNAPSDIVNNYQELFEATISLAFSIYGEYTFCVYKENKKTGRYFWSKKPQLFVYDCVMASLASNINNSLVLIKNKDNIIQDTIELFLSDDDMINGRNTTRKNVEERISKLMALFSKYHD